jgi:hypothetical protein
VSVFDPDERVGCLCVLRFLDSVTEKAENVLGQGPPVASLLLLVCAIDLKKKVAQYVSWLPLPNETILKP